MQEKLDKNGLTEKEFLAQYDASRFERPSVTVDIIIIKNGKVLLIRRGGHPSIGKLAFPGGFLEPDEDVYSAARRELFEETGLKATNLRQLRVASEPNRDPRTRIITVPFLADTEGGDTAIANDDAADAAWYKVSKTELETPKGTLIQIKLSNNGATETFKVLRSLDKSGFRADPIYTPVGETALAGDHSVLLAMALDHLD